MPYSYIDRINAFERWLENNYLPVPSQLMYYKFLSFFNRAGWSEWVSVDNRRVMYVMQQSDEKTMIRTRDKLVNAGLLEYRKGKKGTPNQYRLLDVSTGFLPVQMPVETPVNMPVQMPVETPAIYRYKTKTKDTPLPPKGESGGCEISKPEYRPELFERFWKKYPLRGGRRDGRLAAVKAWDKLKPGMELCRIMSRALDRKNWPESWTRDDGRYIPKASTWLNGRQWEDGAPSERLPEQVHRVEIDPDTGEEMVVFVTE